MLESFQRLQKKSWDLRNEPAKKRIFYLRSLEKTLREHQEDIVTALREDFGKPEQETLLTEIYPLLQEIRFAIRHLREWMRPRPVSTPWSLLSTRCEVRLESKGVCLIIAPWNYPLQLALAPLIPALAAGNAVLLKPSELTPHTSTLIARLLRGIFPPDQVLVVEGGKEVAERILKLPFDHIFFTGSTQVGRIVMRAASEHLTPVTLELGGKSPTLVDESADLKIAAEKIMWGKFINAGQTCVAPDYVLVHEKVFPAFLEECKKTLQNYYPGTGDLARLISSQHRERLQKLLDESLRQGARVEFGGPNEASTLWPPTLLSGVPSDSPLMQEEIFGPLLPFLSYQNLDQALDFIRARPKPLALYIFSRDQVCVERVLKETSSGGVCVNETIMHLANHHLPFGGIGESGMGNYHGYFGFRAFSHEKAILRQSFWGRRLAFLYPPYGPFKKRLIEFLMRFGI